MNAQYFLVIHDLIIQLSYYIRHPYLDTDKAEEMISITLDLLNTLELYLDDQSNNQRKNRRLGTLPFLHWQISQHYTRLNKCTGT